MVLETKKLLLREMNMEDGDALFRLLGDPEIMQHYFNPVLLAAEVWICYHGAKFRLYAGGLRCIAVIWPRKR